MGLGLYASVSREEASALTGLRLRDLGWSGNHPLVLPQLRGIESLRIAGTAPNLHAIRSWTGLRRLVLSGTSSDLALANVTGMPSLRVLSLPVVGLGAATVRVLAARTDLVSLILHFAEGDAELSEPAPVSDDARSLALEAPVPASPWTALAPLTRLGALELDVTDCCVLPLDEPIWLRWLCHHHDAMRQQEVCTEPTER